MSFIPGLTGSPSQFPDGFTGASQKATFKADADATLLSTENGVLYYNVATNRTITLPSTDNDGKTVKAGQMFSFVNRGTSDLILAASGGQVLNATNNCNLLATIKTGGVIIRALQDSPTLATHWWVEYVVERGSFTPTIMGTTTFTTVTYIEQFGRWERINNSIFFAMSVRWNNTTGAPAGALRVEGLPRTVKSGARYWAHVAPSNINYGTSKTHCAGEIKSTTTYFIIAGAQNNAAGFDALASDNSGAVDRTIAAEGFYEPA